MNAITNLLGETLATPTNILGSKNSFIMTALFLGAVIGIGLIGNRMNKQNNPSLMPAGYDTTALGPFSNDEIKSMWEKWRLNATASEDPPWANSHDFLYVARQIPVGGNQLQTNDPVFGNVAGGFNQNITSLASGLYVVVVSSNVNVYAILFKVLSTVNNNLSVSVPSNQVTYPNTYTLEYIQYIDNRNGNYWYY